MNDAGPKGGAFLPWDYATRLLWVMDYLATHHHQVWSPLARSEYEWAIRTLKKIEACND